MIDTAWSGVAISYLAGAALSWAMEAFLVPRPAVPWRRPLAALGIHLGVWTMGYAFTMALYHRPFFAMANALLMQAVLLIVSNAKHRVLNEPFVFPDFDFFWDAVRHPRLYLPFLTAAPVVGALAAFGLILWLGLRLEPALAVPAGPYYLGVAVLAALGYALARVSARRRPALSFDASDDLRRLGLFAALWWYGRSESEPAQPAAEHAPFGARPAAALPSRPRRDLVTIQSESFYDARRAYAALVQPSVLAGFDALRAESARHGPLRVPSWGANTVRTEFSFLSGLGNAHLGVHRYNPYRRLAGQGVPTLASWLKAQGYRTVCVHPYHASFYNRDRVLPALGFDRFIDIEAFRDAPAFGPYVSDQAVIEHVMELLACEQDETPLYVHVITMENHGPLHLESVGEADAAQVLQAPMPPRCADLVAYLRHVRNADRAFTRLADFLRARARPAVLGIYGDHVPSMPHVYRQLGEPDGTTDYLIWRSDQARGGAAPQSAGVEELAVLLARHL